LPHLVLEERCGTCKLGHPSCVHDEHLVAVHDRVESVSNDKAVEHGGQSGIEAKTATANSHGARSELATDDGLNLLVGLRVDGRGRLVEHQYLAVAKKSALWADEGSASDRREGGRE
jgi:hypothetical protein